MSALHIYDPRERRLVALADAVLSPLRWFARRPAPGPVRRVLLLRLERIGDLLMTLDAIDAARRAWPEAEVDLAVGRWNRALAQLIPGLHGVQQADAPWLVRPGESPAGWRALLAQAWEWRRRRYDLVLNFEPDIRSNLLAWLSGAARRVGFWTGGGGRFLTEAMAYAPDRHVAANTAALVDLAAGRPIPAAASSDEPMLQPSADAEARARVLLEQAPRPWVGVHASGGRESKQWHLDRFAAVASALSRDRGATIVLTGSAADRGMVDEVKGRLTGVRVVDASGSLDLPTLAAVLARLDVFVTGDTGPMHLAAAMRTPIVALFGPSNPVRYGPLAPLARVIRVDLPCSPCGQVRLPPVRCRGHVPECLDRIAVDDVVAAAIAMIDRASLAPATAGRTGAGRRA